MCPESPGHINMKPFLLETLPIPICLECVSGQQVFLCSENQPEEGWGCLKNHFTFLFSTSSSPEEHHPLLIPDIGNLDTWSSSASLSSFSAPSSLHTFLLQPVLLLPLDRRSRGGIGLEELVGCLRLAAILEPHNLQDWPFRQLFPGVAVSAALLGAVSRKVLSGLIYFPPPVLTVA